MCTSMEGNEECPLVHEVGMLFESSPMKWHWTRGLCHPGLHIPPSNRLQPRMVAILPGHGKDRQVGS